MLGGAALLALVAAVPPPARAVNTCQAALSMEYVGGPNFPVAGSVLRVKLTLGLFAIAGGTKVTVNRVRFELDCAESAPGVPCADLGSVVEYEGDDTITTTCVDDTQQPISWSSGHAPSPSPNEVVFTPSLPIDFPSETLAKRCELAFDVKLLSQTCSQTSPSALDPCTIVQFAGFVVADGDAPCDNGFSSGALQTVASPLCNYPTGAPCDDHDPCTVDACNLDTGACMWTAVTCPPTPTWTPSDTPTVTPTAPPTPPPTVTPTATRPPPTITPTPFGTPFHVCATAADVQTVVLTGTSYCPTEGTALQPGVLVAERSLDRGAYRISNALVRFPVSPTLDLKAVTSATISVDVTELVQADDDASAIAWEYFPWFTDATQCVSCSNPDSPPCSFLPLPAGYHTCTTGGINLDPTVTGLGEYVQPVNPDTMACLLPQPDGYAYAAIQESPTRHAPASAPSGLNRVILSVQDLPCLDGYAVDVTPTPLPPTATPAPPVDCTSGADVCAVTLGRDACVGCLCGADGCAGFYAACAAEGACLNAGQCPCPMSSGCSAFVLQCAGADECNCAPEGTTAPPTATPAATPTPTGAVVTLGDAVGRPGGVACVAAHLAGGAGLSTVTNQIGFDATRFTFLDAIINPAIAQADQLSRLDLGTGLESFSVTGPQVQDGLLYTAEFGIAPSVEPGTYVLSDSAGGAIRVTTCAGDCDGNSVVTIGEVTRCVSLFLGRPLCDPAAPISSCPVADVDGNGAVSIGEVTGCVNRFLLGCP